MPTYRFKQVDAFTSRPLFGNPVAVVLEADTLSAEQMRRIANWTNLSETTFVLKPSVPRPAYRLRIFTPTHELPFAGHPTIGSCHAVLESGVVAPADGRLVQECGAGNLSIRIEGDGPERHIGVEAPEAKLMGEYPELRPRLTDILGAPVAQTPPPTAFRNGPTWLFVRFEKESDVAGLKPDMSPLAALSADHRGTGVAAFALLDGGEFAVHIRCFAPAAGVPEDPVTGSANAALPAYLVHHGLLDRTGRAYVATQATEMGRDGRVPVRVLDETGRAEIGGQAVTVIDGEISI
ncbi:MAG: PhzF family phenazine biosynthesis protein [Chloroflexi bacterium]|nr:MAG: PhzF family phenazine biosynthesis protein [Chloroflexota bacterium]